MQKEFMMVTAAALMAGSGFAKEKSESISDIFNELSTYKPGVAAEAAPAPVEAAPAVEAAPIEAIVESAPEAEMVEEVASAEEAETSEQTGDMAQVGSVQGVSEVINGSDAPTGKYTRSKLERGQRNVEIASIKQIDAAWCTEMVFRSYSLSSDACEKMGLEEGDVGQDAKGVFKPVNFPKGSSAIYQPKMKALFVRNTRENLLVLESVLGAMDLAKLEAEVDQVEIEAKFVEVSEGTLEELGFQWNFDDPRDGSIGGTDLEVNDGSAGLFAESLRGSPESSTANSKIPFNRDKDLGYGKAAAAGGAWTSFSFADTFNSTPGDMSLKHNGDNPFKLLISALDQSSGTDVLSAPRVVTRCGYEATIRVGELHSFPEVYEGNTSQATMLHVSYQDFSDKLLGVELAVTPELDGEQIRLSLNPRITELAGWRNYQLAAANSIYNYRQVAGQELYRHGEVVARLPIFKKREIETEVTIANGSTIGMGGMINEKVESFQDKVPVLGSIPLIGRLFRNEGERVVKRNLLMFVTARSVEPSGRVNTSRSFE